MTGLVFVQQLTTKFEKTNLEGSNWIRSTALKIVQMQDCTVALAISATMAGIQTKSLDFRHII